jgi:NAD(P)-dependent dehydrogenase (short-subunit alcohol dehydrogenase family)
MSGKMKNQQVAIISGGSGAIGSVVVRRLKAQGFKTAVVDLEYYKGDNPPDTQYRTVRTKRHAYLLVDDVKRMGNITALVNCMGLNIRKPVYDYEEHELDTMMDSNMKYPFFLMQAVGQHMQANREGSIVNVASIQATTCWNGRGSFSLAPYCASKAALVALTKAFALELAPHGVRVNAVSPAFVSTKPVKKVLDDPVLLDDVNARTPIGRPATTDEIADVVMYLLGRDSSYITGHNLLADGGWTIQ